MEQDSYGYSILTTKIMITYTTSQTPQDIQQILDLQLINLPQNISSIEAQEQGFVTVHHNYDLLSEMGKKFPHIIAKSNNQVIGYTLVMLPEFGDKIPVLLPLFQKINSLVYKDEQLKIGNYFVMGQVCIHKDYRGQNIFKNLYAKMKEVMSPHFKYIITEIATRNTRSMRAHEKVGFETITVYSTDKEEWAIVAWDWN